MWQNFMELQTIAVLPDFLGFFATGVLLVVIFMTIYVLLTPHKEFQLVRQGDTAAGFAFGGTLIGYVLPVSKAVAEAPTVWDMLVWSIVGLVIQLLVYFAVRLLVPGISKKIEENNVGAGVFLACASIAIGLITAGAMNLDLSSHAD
jgi:putative membrane protein